MCHFWANWSSLGHKVATQKTDPQNVSLLGKWSSLGHEVANQKTEPQNVSPLGKWSSLGHGNGNPENRALKCVTFGQMVQSGG